MQNILVQGSTDPRKNSLHFSRIKIFGIYLHSQFLLLLIAEISIAALAVYVGGLYLDGISALDFDFDNSVYSRVVTFPLVFSLSLAGVGLYSSRQPLNFHGIVTRFGVAIILAGLLFAILYTVFPYLSVSLDRFLILMVVTLVCLGILRICFYRFSDTAFLNRRILVVGSGQKAKYITDLYESTDQNCFELVGFVTSNAGIQSVSCINKNYCATIDMLLGSFIREYHINEVVVALDERRQGFPVAELMDCKMAGVPVLDLQDFLERESGKLNLTLLSPGWLTFSNGFTRYFFSDFVKRCFDIICSVFLLIIASPVMLLSVIAIWLEDGSKSSIFYRQIRVGKNNKEFEILKFRSMQEDAEKDGVASWAAKADPRITKVGTFLRDYRIDEIPQLINVLIGNMSLVGPRPERPEIVSDLCNENMYYSERHRVKPGLTGWAQLRFKYGASLADAMEKLQYDLYYMKNANFLLDLYILIQTIEVVLFRKGSR